MEQQPQFLQDAPQQTAHDRQFSCFCVKRAAENQVSSFFLHLLDASAGTRGVKTLEFFTTICPKYDPHIWSKEINVPFPNVGSLLRCLRLSNLA
jgi:hypothetical protein